MLTPERTQLHPGDSDPPTAPASGRLLPRFSAHLEKKDKGVKLHNKLRLPSSGRIRKVFVGKMVLKPITGETRKTKLNYFSNST